MAEKKETQDAAIGVGLGGGWKEGTRQTTARQIRHGKAVATCQPLGGVELNVASTRLSDQVARDRGLPPEQGYIFKYLTNEVTGLLGLYATKTTGEGTISINRYEKGASARITFHAGAPYLDAPSLRPDQKVKCLVKVEPHPKDGLPMLAIAIKAGSPTNTRSRPPSASEKS